MEYLLQGAAPLGQGNQGGASMIPADQAKQTSEFLAAFLAWLEETGQAVEDVVPKWVAYDGQRAIEHDDRWWIAHYAEHSPRYSDGASGHEAMCLILHAIQQELDEKRMAAVIFGDQWFVTIPANRMYWTGSGWSDFADAKAFASRWEAMLAAVKAIRAEK
jgi:hypothetical protein